MIETLHNWTVVMIRCMCKFFKTHENKQMGAFYIDYILNKVGFKKYLDLRHEILE